MPSSRRALQRAVKWAAAGADRFRRPRAGVVVLIYHRVGGGSGLEIDLPAPLFEAQMAALADARRTVTLAAALDRLARTEPADPGPSPVVVTFDDGTADFVDHALPILERHRIPVTLYAATAYIDEGRAFPDDGAAVSWAALADACSTGLVDVGSHTHRHRLLDRLAASEVGDELDRSRGLIAERLQRPALDFAYPKAVAGSADADRLVRARFRSAALAGTRTNHFGSTDVHRLARSPVQTSDAMTWFRHKAAGGMALEDTLRRLLNRRRYADAAT